MTVIYSREAIIRALTTLPNTHQRVVTAAAIERMAPAYAAWPGSVLSRPTAAHLCNAVWDMVNADQVPEILTQVGSYYPDPEASPDLLSSFAENFLEAIELFLLFVSNSDPKRAGDVLQAAIDLADRAAGELLTPYRSASFHGQVSAELQEQIDNHPWVAAEAHRQEVDIERARQQSDSQILSDELRRLACAQPVITVEDFTMIEAKQRGCWISPS